VSLPAVTLVILYRDREAQIIKTLDSITGQKYAGPLEVIIVEDGDEIHDRLPSKWREL
jgi:hypothetical protein